MTWAWGPFLAFDTETTGTDPETAQIVQYGLVTVGPDAPLSRTECHLVNQNIEIPEEATAVHGITAEMCRADGLSIGDALDNIMGAIGWAHEQGTPLVIFNAVYDLTVLDRELTRRFGQGLDYDNLPPIIDPLVLVNRRAWKRPHNLEHACEVWKVPAGGHDAGQDALAAARLLWRLGQEMRVQIKPEDWNKPTGYGTTIDDLTDVPVHILQAAQARWYREDAESYIRNQQDKGRDPGHVNTHWPVIRRPRLVKETA